MNQKDGLFQREKGGPWYAVYNKDGVRYVECTGFGLKGDARPFLDAMRTAIDKGTYVRPRDRKKAGTRGANVGALSDKWLAIYIAVNRKDKDQKQADYRATTYLKPFMGDLPAASVTKDTLRQYRAYLEGLTVKDAAGKERPRLSIQTVAHVLADARCLFSWAHDMGHIDTLPVPRKLLPKVPELLPRRLSADEEKAVCALEGPLGLACRIMVGTGARFGELCRLTAADIVNGELAIQGETKTRKLRLVPIPPALLRELMGHVGKLVPYEPKDDPTFIRSVQRASGVADFSAHRCRHSYAMNYLERGGTVRGLQLNMGHASLDTTEIYLRGGQDLQRSEAKRVMGWSATA